MKIFLDFDGTLVEHQYPEIGHYNKGAFEVIQKLQATNHQIILNTFRADCNNGTLEKALDYINNNPNYVVEPLLEWKRRKISPPDWDLGCFIRNKQIFIDDESLEIPLKPATYMNGVVVDWTAIDKQFIENGIYGI